MSQHTRIVGFTVKLEYIRMWYRRGVSFSFFFLFFFLFIHLFAHSFVLLTRAIYNC